MSRKILVLSLAMFFAVGLIGSAQTQKRSKNGPLECAVTRPNGVQPPTRNFGGTITYPAEDHGPPPLFPGQHAHGNGTLWTVLPVDGKILLAPNRDGSISDKFMWWRSVEGTLTIEGHRVDAPARHVKPDIPRGYGDTGFQASGITFPSEGCWQITGKVGDSALSFVVEVRAKK